MPRCKGDDQVAVDANEYVAHRNEAAAAVANERIDDSLDPVSVTRSGGDNLYGQGFCRSIERAQIVWTASTGSIRIKNDSSAGDLWRNVLEQLQPFPNH